MAPGRIEFVILRTGCSPPAALHLASRRRSCSRLQAGERLPEEDLHLSDHSRFQAHIARGNAPGNVDDKSLSSAEGAEQFGMRTTVFRAFSASEICPALPLGRCPRLLHLAPSALSGFNLSEHPFHRQRIFQQSIENSLRFFPNRRID